MSSLNDYVTNTSLTIEPVHSNVSLQNMIRSFVITIPSVEVYHDRFSVHPKENQIQLDQIVQGDLFKKAILEGKIGNTELELFTCNTNIENIDEFNTLFNPKRLSEDENSDVLTDVQVCLISMFVSYRLLYTEVQEAIRTALIDRARVVTHLELDPTQHVTYPVEGGEHTLHTAEENAMDLSITIPKGVKPSPFIDSIFTNVIKETERVFIPGTGTEEQGWIKRSGEAKRKLKTMYERFHIILCRIIESLTCYIVKHYSAQTSDSGVVIMVQNLIRLNTKYEKVDTIKTLMFDPEDSVKQGKSQNPIQIQKEGTEITQGESGCTQLYHGNNGQRGNVIINNTSYVIKFDVDGSRNQCFYISLATILSEYAANDPTIKKKINDERFGGGNETLWQSEPNDGKPGIVSPNQLKEWLKKKITNKGEFNNDTEDVNFDTNQTLYTEVLNQVAKLLGRPIAVVSQNYVKQVESITYTNCEGVKVDITNEDSFNLYNAEITEQYLNDEENVKKHMGMYTVKDTTKDVIKEECKDYAKAFKYYYVIQLYEDKNGKKEKKDDGTSFNGTKGYYYYKCGDTYKKIFGSITEQNFALISGEIKNEIKKCATPETPDTNLAENGYLVNKEYTVIGVSRLNKTYKKMRELKYEGSSYGFPDEQSTSVQEWYDKKHDEPIAMILHAQFSDNGGHFEAIRMNCVEESEITKYSASGGINRIEFTKGDSIASYKGNEVIEVDTNDLAKGISTLESIYKILLDTQEGDESIYTVLIESFNSIGIFGEYKQKDNKNFKDHIKTLLDIYGIEVSELIHKKISSATPPGAEVGAGVTGAGLVAPPAQGGGKRKKQHRRRRFIRP